MGLRSNRLVFPLPGGDSLSSSPPPLHQISGSKESHKDHNHFLSISSLEFSFILFYLFTTLSQTLTPPVGKEQKNYLFLPTFKTRTEIAHSVPFAQHKDTAKKRHPAERVTAKQNVVSQQLRAVRQSSKSTTIACHTKIERGFVLGLLRCHLSSHGPPSPE